MRLLPFIALAIIYVVAGVLIIYYSVKHEDEWWPQESDQPTGTDTNSAPPAYSPPAPRAGQPGIGTSNSRDHTPTGG